MMGAHWDATGDRVEVAMNPKPKKSPVGQSCHSQSHHLSN